MVECGANLTTPHVYPQKPFTPVKYFSIDRVFRNETLDSTHLAEFHQIEGVVADYGLTLGHLMGVLQEFFTKLGTPWLAYPAGLGCALPTHPHSRSLLSLPLRNHPVAFQASL